MVKHKNTLSIATNSGRLRYMEIDEQKGNYCSKVNILEGHNEAIMSVKIHNNKMITCSKDKSVNLYTIEDKDAIADVTVHCAGNTVPDDNEKRCKRNTENKEQTDKPQAHTPDTHSITHIAKLQSHTDSVNSCDLSDEIIVSVSKDMTLQIYKNKNTPVQVFTGLVHTKEINAVKIMNEHKTICTASQDKTLKLFDYNGNNIATLFGHKRGVWNFDFGKEIIASCSTDETIMIWSIRNHVCTKVLDGCGSSVLNVKIFNSDKQIASASNNGLIRIYDVKKGKLLTTLTEHKEKIWSILYDKYINSASVDGTINLFADETEEVTTKLKEEEKEVKEMSFKLQKYLREKNHIEALRIAGKQKENEHVYDLVFTISANKKDIETMLLILSEDKAKFFMYLEKWLKQYKTAEVTKRLVNFAIDKNLLTKKHQAILKLLAKQLKASDCLLRNLYTHELLFKNFL